MEERWKKIHVGGGNMWREKWRKKRERWSDIVCKISLFVFTIKELCFPLYTNLGNKYTLRGSKRIIEDRKF